MIFLISPDLQAAFLFFSMGKENSLQDVKKMQ